MLEKKCPICIFENEIVTFESYVDEFSSKLYEEFDLKADSLGLQSKIDDLFNDVILINKDTELKNLVIFKKGLYFSDKLSENELLEILNPIINSESIWKQHALLLMGDFYFHNKQLNKSKEFFTLITELDNVNPKLKTDIERRLRRDFSE